METIQVFITGGTFDKEYNLITGKLYFKDTHLHHMFERGRCVVKTDIKTLMMVDSLELTEEDRVIIIHNCKRSPYNKIILTHGTDRMVHTATVLAQEKIEGKTIILTGFCTDASSRRLYSDEWEVFSLEQCAKGYGYWII